MANPLNDERRYTVWKLRHLYGMTSAEISKESGVDGPSLRFMTHQWNKQARDIEEVKKIAIQANAIGNDLLERLYYMLDDPEQRSKLSIMDRIIKIMEKKMALAGVTTVQNTTYANINSVTLEQIKTIYQEIRNADNTDAKTDSGQPEGDGEDVVRSGADSGATEDLRGHRIQTPQ